MTQRSWLSNNVRCYCAATFLCFAAMNIGPACAQIEIPRAAPQLEQLVASIALYPDTLLSQVLMASTYPLEVVAAARWVQVNPGVTGKALEDAMQKQPWDPSVKALTAVPQTLQMMNDKLDWTRDLGDAFLAQQSEVLVAVQRLRERADNAGNLKTTEQQRVVKTAAPAGESSPVETPAAGTPATVYTIESVNPDEYCVPIYDPGVVYGAWPKSVSILAARIGCLGNLSEGLYHGCLSTTPSCAVRASSLPISSPSRGTSLFSESKA
jgi:hypothetical protein